MRLLMLLSDWRRGGAESAALTLTGAMVGRGHVVMAAAVRDRGDMAALFERAGATVHRRLAAGRLDLLAPLRLRSLIRRRAIDAVVLVDAPRHAMVYLAALRWMGCRVPMVCWCHSVPNPQAGQFIPRLRGMMRWRVFQALVCVSRYHRRTLERHGLPRRKSCVIYNGIDVGRYAGAAQRQSPPSDLHVPAGKKLVVQVANVMPIKDFETLLSAAGLLARRRDDFHLVLIGRDTDGPSLKAAARAAGVGACLTAAGSRQDVPAILAAADVFVLSTHDDIFSVATLEAMASAAAVVVSDIAAFDEMFRHERQGLKVAPRNAAAMAEAIQRLLNDEPLRRQLAAAAVQHVRRFDVEPMAERFDRLLRKLVH